MKANDDIQRPGRQPHAADNARRVEIIDELYRRYASSSITAFSVRIRFFWKKHSWRAVVGGANLVKRMFDLLVSLTMLLMLIPLFAVVAAAVKLTDGGPVLFWQTRVGKWGREFQFPKFRSMVVNAEAIKAELAAQSHHGDSITFKMKKDPRVTWIGRIIRKLSIDELPQIWNVIRGEMSIVGPRPPIPSEVAQYTLADRRRLDIKPGLTCLWQIGGRGDIPFDRQVELDRQYIDSRSLWVDLKILLKTIPAVLTGKGAY